MSNPIVWTPGVSLESLERQVIQRAFSFFKENKTATAAALGIAIRTLDAKLAKYGKEAAEAEAQADGAKARQADFLLRCRGQHPDQRNPPAPAPLAAAK